MSKRTLLTGVFVYKAQDVLTPVPDMIITAKQPVPESGSSPADLLKDAKKIVAALTASLPQGTLGRVAALLAMDQASQLVVRYQDISGSARARRKKVKT